MAEAQQKIGKVDESGQYGARVVLALENDFAKAVNDNGLHYTNDVALKGLKEALDGLHATLANVMRDFEYYVQSSDAHGAAPSPMINWSRDATQNDRAKEYYSTKFVVALGAGRKIFDFTQAQQIADALKHLEGQGVVTKVRIDSMDPAQNPPIPERYFP